MSTDRPKSPDAAWVATLKIGAEVVVIDPVPWRAVYAATVKRITPTGRITLAHKNGGDPAGMFRPNGYAWERGHFGYWPRFLMSPEALSALGESVR